MLPTGDWFCDCGAHNYGRNGECVGLDIKAMQVEVTIGVQQPDAVDVEAVRRSLPYGVVTVKAVKGGLNVPAEESHDLAVIASAAIAVRFDLP